jgi:hypothetical protein
VSMDIDLGHPAEAVVVLYRQQQHFTEAPGAQLCPLCRDIAASSRGVSDLCTPAAHLLTQVTVATDETLKAQPLPSCI